MSLNTDFDSHGYDNGGFLADLQPPIKRYPFEGRQQFIDTWKAEWRRQQNAPTDSDVSEWILFTNVDKRTFTQDFLDPSEPWTEICWSSFDASQALLLVKMPNAPPHEVAAALFNNLFFEAVEPTGLKYALRYLKSATFHGSSGSKEADFSWAPKRTPPGHSQDWPTVVLEVAYSETKSKLMSDVRFWLHQSQGDVKVVVTLLINRQTPEITIETWELQNDRPHRMQQLIVSKAKNQQITVRNDPLAIQFASLFLRPASIPKETDIKVDAEKLQLLATNIWDEQKF
ncbi:hypothetical protein PHISP_04504 [Aspergillus sp. HF37]|nr:hypothetical protein PHISP_04504 [Aspergillus sp. HF37]